MAYEGFFSSRRSSEWCGSVGVFDTETEALEAAQRKGDDCDATAVWVPDGKKMQFQPAKAGPGRQFIRKCIKVYETDKGWEIVVGNAYVNHHATWDAALADLQGLLEQERRTA